MFTYVFYFSWKKFTLRKENLFFPIYKLFRQFFRNILFVVDRHVKIQLTKIWIDAFYFHFNDYVGDLH